MITRLNGQLIEGMSQSKYITLLSSRIRHADISPSDLDWLNNNVKYSHCNYCPYKTPVSLWNGQIQEYLYKHRRRHHPFRVLINRRKRKR